MQEQPSDNVRAKQTPVGDTSTPRPDAVGAADADAELDPTTAGLAAAVLEIARHVEDSPAGSASSGTAHPRFFALVSTAQMLQAQPALASVLGEDAAMMLASDPYHLTSVELEPHGSAASDASAPTDPLQALEQVAWPQPSSGGAMVCDLAADHWSIAADNAASATSSTAATPGTSTDVDALRSRLGAGRLRVIIASLADGTTWTALQPQSRTDGPGQGEQFMGPALMPELTAALADSVAADGVEQAT